MNQSTANTTVTTFAWGDIALSEVVYIDGVPHATRRAIGEWLEYEDPQEGVRKLLNRNPHIESHSITVKMSGMLGAREYETSVYHPIGFLLIVMESGQPRAYAKKAAVAEFVWHYAGPRQISDRSRLDLLKLRRQLIADVTGTRDAFAQAALLSDLREISLALGMGLPDVALLGTDTKQLLLKEV